MFPAAFDYERATSVAGALDRIATHADAGREVELLAGGHGLVPALKARERTPDVVVDLDVDDLREIRVTDDHLVVGALATDAAVAASEAVRTHAPVLAEAAAAVGDRQIRNRGTVGGNLAEAHPAADPPAAVLAADATLALRGPTGEREVPATEFFRGDRETAIDDREVLTEIRLPRAGDETAAYVRRTHPASGYALVGVAAILAVDEGAVTSARVAATGATARPRRLPSVEAELAGLGVDDVTGEGGDGDETGGVGETDVTGDPGSSGHRSGVEAAAAAAVEDVADARLRSDPYASGEYRRRLLVAEVERAVRRALG